MGENIILILNENRMEVNKETLASKSRYFQSLFSHNFSDSHNKEHVINYDVALCTLQNFVEFIHDDNARISMQYHSIKISMTKFVRNNFIELLNLLQLSVLFMVDDLTNDAIDIIISYWLLPEKVIDIWLLAQELNIKVLQDVCLSVSLDRFEELPVPLLVELTKDNITRLIKNVNARSSIEYLNFIRNEWMKYHLTSDIAEIKEDRQLKFLRGTIMYNVHESVPQNAYLYTWNGNNLSKRVQLKNTQDPGKWIAGMQVASRGFSIYTIGGEKGLGTGQFNVIIWRYCLLSNKWYYQAKLPVPRRHMVTAFLKNQLVIVGGVGRHRLKLCTIDILDIHTGNWTKGAKVPESFTDVPPHCVLNGKLFLLKSSVYIYSLEEDCWQTVSILDPFATQVVDAFLTHGTALFITHNRLGGTARIEAVKDSICEKGECLNQYIEHCIITKVRVVHEDDSYQLRYACAGSIAIMMLNEHRDDKYQYVHLHVEIWRDFENSYIPKLGCLNIIDPDSLYDTV